MDCVSRRNPILKPTNTIFPVKIGSDIWPLHPKQIPGRKDTVEIVIAGGLNDILFQTSVHTAAGHGATAAHRCGHNLMNSVRKNGRIEPAARPLGVENIQLHLVLQPKQPPNSIQPRARFTGITTRQCREARQQWCRR